MSSSEENVKIESAGPTVDTEPAVDATFKHKLTNTDLFGKDELNIKKGTENQKEIEKVLFSYVVPIVTKLKNVNTLLESSNLGSNKFNEVFKAEKKVLDIGSDKFHLYKKKSGYLKNPTSSNKGTAIRIVCAAYFKKSPSGEDKIIIAYRLDTDHKDDPEIKGESLTKGGGPKDKSMAMIKVIENLVINKKTQNITNKKEILPRDLKEEFEEKMTDILKPPSLFATGPKKEFAKDSTVYEEYSISDKLDKKINNKFLKFDVEFSIIFVENKKTIYYSINQTWHAKNDTDIHEYKGPAVQPAVLPAVQPAVLPAVQPAVAVAAAAPAAAPAAAAAPANSLKEQKENLKKRVNAADTEVQKLKENANANEAEQTVKEAEQTVKEAKNKIENISEKERIVEEKNGRIRSLSLQQTFTLTEQETGEFGIHAEKAELVSAEEAVKEAVNAAEEAVKKAEEAVKEAEEAVNAVEKAVKEAEEEATVTGVEKKVTYDSMGRPVIADGAGRQSGGVGGKRKLTRKQLNIMTLTELKQLHKVNKIKMNNNRTIKALINNYIKNYKKKIISKTKIGR